MKGARYQGLLYRALNPLYAKAPLSGRGASIHGGRFNRRGLDTLYMALAPETAIREANQVGTLQPTTLVAYRANVAPVFDTRDRAALGKRHVSDAKLADPSWREAMLRGDIAPTQSFADALIGDGFAGMLVRSFALGAKPGEFNLVLWRWNSTEDDVLELVDDEGRLKS